MEQYIDILISSRLFSGMDVRQVKSLLARIGARTVVKESGEYFILQNNIAADVSVVVGGKAEGERVSADGSIVVVNEFLPGDVFGDVLSGASVPNLVGVRAVTKCTAVVFKLDDLLEPRAGAIQQQKLLLRNLIGVISDKFFALNSRISLLLCKSLRAKIAMYLIMQADSTGSGSFAVSHNREEMARYLGCERSAMSREISRMAGEGIIIVGRRNFTIPDRKKLEELAGV